MRAAWVLAAGQAKRCPNKLSKDFCGLTLPEWACVFARANGFDPQIIGSQRLPGTAGALDGRSGLVLFGDNYYHGKMLYPNMTTGFTWSFQECAELALAFPDFVQEKPHGMCGRQPCLPAPAYRRR